MEEDNQQSEIEERGEELRRSEITEKTGSHNPAIENKSNLWTTLFD
jgi:hypothetical protein